MIKCQFEYDKEICRRTLNFYSSDSITAKHFFVQVPNDTGDRIAWLGVNEAISKGLEKMQS